MQHCLLLHFVASFVFVKPPYPYPHDFVLIVDSYVGPPRLFTDCTICVHTESTTRVCRDMLSQFILHRRLRISFLPLSTLFSKLWVFFFRNYLKKSSWTKCNPFLLLVCFWCNADVSSEVKRIPSLMTSFNRVCSCWDAQVLKHAKIQGSEQQHQEKHEKG